MQTSFLVRATLMPALLVAGAVGMSPAHAQNAGFQNAATPGEIVTMEPTSAGYSGGTSRDLRYSWLPYTTAGYVGVSAGGGEFHTACVAGLQCDDPDVSGKIYTGGMLTPYLGVELGYVQWGEAERNGGSVQARGVNAMLTGFLPLGSMFTAVGRVGTTYGWTKTTLGAGVVAPSGSANGFGLAFGGGLSFDFNQNWSATLDWERHQLKFKNSDRQDVDLTSLGIKYRF